MERGSTQHGARLDDELSDATDGLVHGASPAAREREDLDPEAPGADEIDLTVGPSEDDTRPALAHDDVVARSELARWLRPSSFPGTTLDLRAAARDDGAPDDLLAVLDALDPRTRFETFGDVWAAVGGPAEERRDAPAEPEAPTPPPAATATPRATATPPAAPAPPPPTPAPIVREGEAPELAGPLVTAWQLAMFPARLTIAVVREVYRVGRRVVGG